MENNDILFNNIGLLFDKNHIFEIVPTKSMNNSQKVNAIIRFSLFLSILIYLFTENYLYLYIFLITIVVAYFIYIFSNKEFFQGEKGETNKKSQEESGDKSSEATKHPKKENKIKVECVMPTTNNPLMNPLIGERKSYKKTSCPNTEEKIEGMIESKINASILDPSTKYFQRNMYTMPNTSTPNDQTTFAKWLYNTPVSCSEGKHSVLNQKRACAYNNKSLHEY